MTFGPEDFAREVDVSRETLRRLCLYEELLKKWNPRINLIAPSTLNDIWQRHFLDSAQVSALAHPGAERWVDLGSGGGLPGVVVALLRAEHSPPVQMTLVESDQRKCVFLRTVARELGLDINVKNQRIEQLDRQNADVLSARALAPLNKLLEYADLHLAASGECLFLKGKTAKDEIAEARKTWDFSLHEFTSMTDPQASILRIKEISRV